MYIPKKLKLNRFRAVLLPSAKEIIGRFGLCEGSNYSGDKLVARQMDKLDAAASLDDINDYYNSHEQYQQDHPDQK